MTMNVLINDGYYIIISIINKLLGKCHQREDSLLYLTHTLHVEGSGSISSASWSPSSIESDPKPEANKRYWGNKGRIGIAIFKNSSIICLTDSDEMRDSPWDAFHHNGL